MEKSKGSGKQTLVEEGTELKGTLKSTCHVVVNGSIDGQIEAPSLTVTETGTVLGTVKAEQLRSEGTLAGDIDAEDVYLSGTVRSNTMIRAKKLEVKLAPERGKLEVTFGECLIEVGEDPMHREEAAQAPAPVEAATAGAPPEPEAPPLAAQASPPLASEDEPTWSEPPPMGAAPSPAPDAAASAADAEAEAPPAEPTGEAANAADESAEADQADAAADGDSDVPRAENRRRRSRGGQPRDSQAPPA